MAPKLLTDCPENLREAIDWLVQVQHCGGVSTVSDALSTLFDNVAQDAEKSLSSLPDPDRPSARGVVSKLRAFKSTLPKDSANPNKNIIHNLCASAASLLGYRSTGTYDGSGIVYGNASRLCDAILAFLYAVFSDVHGNQPYVAGRSVLYNDVIAQLKSQLWRGGKGFCQVIPKVANGLRDYNVAVKASNDRVKKPIETVLDYVKTDGELRRGIQALQILETSPSAEDERTVESAVSLVGKCKEVAKIFSKSLTAATNAINDLNPKLERKLENARKSFFNHVDWLSRWSKKGEKKKLDKMIEKIKSRLRQLAKAVKDRIKQEVHTVVDLLKKRVREIKMKLKDITGSLEKYVKELGAWMGEAKEYIKDVKKYVKQIMQQLDGENKKKIDEAAAEIDSELGKKVGELNEWIDQADAAVKAAKKKADEVHKRLDKNSGTTIGQGIEKITTAKKAVSEVSTQLHTVHDDLSNWKGVAQDVLSKSVQKAKEVSEQLDPSQHGAGNPIGKNLNQINSSNEEIGKANDQLKNQVDKLQEWIADADRIREQAQQKAQEVSDSLEVHEQLSEKIKEIQTANQEIKEVNTGLGDVEKSLEGWNQEARDVIQGVVKKAEDVYKKLNHGDGEQPISQGIKQIKDARANVEAVDKGLKDVNSDLQKWREAATLVLTTTIDKASEVHEQLDPAKDDDSHPIGKNIKDIGDAKKELDSANEQLKSQVDNLSKWIHDAEDIRHKAETKAREAYDKLQVHKALSDNVDKIVKAKDKINLAHSAVDAKVRELGTWREKAEKVLGGAIKKAEEVYKGLEDNVDQQIDTIGADNKEIATASTKLAREVEDLGKWKDTAGKVIAKAENKCDEILRRVKTDPNGQSDTIYKQATLLKDSGTNLLQAAKDAKQTVEKNVAKALEAVKAMDSDLRTDLKLVKDNITRGIEEVISDLQVGELGAKVKEDLQKLKEKIAGLKNKVDKGNDNDGSLVKKELDALDKAKNTLTEESRKIKRAAEQEMDQQFQSAIKKPLESAVEKVTMEIGKLYTTVGGVRQNNKSINNVISLIKDRVGDILRGENGRTDKGLKGIEKGLVQSYAGGFQGDKFIDIVGGWLDDILGRKQKKVKQNDKLKAWLAAYVKAKHSGGSNLTIDSVSDNIIIQIKAVFSEEIKEAGQAVEEGSRKASSTSKIKETVSAVKQGCEKLVEGLDEKFKNGELVSVAQQIQVHQSGRKNNEAHNFLNEITLIGLRAVASQVADEIESILLGDYRVGINGTKTSIAEELDRVIGVTQDLDTKLGQATNTSTSGGKHPVDGTAHAVDKAIEGVSNEIKGLERKFNDVKQPVEDAAQRLEGAVEAYDKQAKEQVKKAAKEAIEAAANEINQNGDKSQIDLSNKMSQFNDLNQKIQDGLAKNLQALLNTHVGNDDPSSPSGVPAGSSVNSQPNRVTLADRMFTNYRTHITQPVDSSKDPNGKLTTAIKEIGSKGLANLQIIGNSGSMINTQTFDEPVNKIEEELKEIKKLVSQNGGISRDDRGVKNFLEDLRSALDSGTLDGVFERGLSNIRSAIEGLQKGTLDLKSKAISKAVEEISKEIEVLKKKLKNSKGNDVVATLSDFKNAGLGINNDWQPNDSGKSISGLGKIRKKIEEQNQQLPKLTAEIDDAINKIRWELACIGFKLQGLFTTNDVIDKLTWLKSRIGNGENMGLQAIQKHILRLQKTEFHAKPEAIGKAKQAIDAELKKLQGELRNEVSSKLTDLVDKGFGPGDKWNGNDVKGFDNIKSNLQSQQSELSNQPAQIDSGINEITDELQSLRTELQGTGDGNPQGRGVMKNLEFMMQQIGNKDNEGLKNIKTEIESLNQSQVPLITQNLHTLSLNITTTAGNLGWNLNQLETPHIDVKLKGIETGLTNLRLKDLAAAINLCDDFLSKAYEIEKNTIAALWKHVDYEVDDAIKDLTKQARGLYVDSVREALELFARKVNEDLEQLPNEINRDRYMGYKGFMRYLQGPLTSDLTGDEQSVAELSSALQEVFEQIEKYVKGEITRLHDEQNREQNPLLPPTAEPYTPKINDVYEALTELLVYLRDNDGDADRLTELVERLARALSNLVPADFKHPSTPLLDTVALGLTKFAGEFGNTYVSAYSGQRCREEHAHKYAKVLLSMIPMTHQALTKLMVKCENEWKSLHICEFTAEDMDNPLGNYLTRCGYRVSRNESGQDGELNNMFTGAGIYELLTTSIEDVDIEMLVDGEPVKNGINLINIMSLLYNTLCQYLQVCHIPVPPNPRYPCTVRDMLSWLSGLQYTRVADKLPDHCKALLNRKCHVGDTPNKEDPVMAKCIGELPHTIATTCSYSTALLTAIQGNGHGFDLAAYPYSVDFSNNRAKLHYPDYPDALLDMLRDIVCRLCKVLYFLYTQCCRSTAHVKGWRECAYGRQVQSHNWQCGQFGTYSSTISTTTATTTSSTPTHGCPPTSPLQSFLSDSCHGLLPHILTADHMKIECANCTAKQPGQQCLTPLGFWDLGFAASISGTGWYLAKRLGDMCRDADSCLFVLCRTLFCLCPAAPSSLADVFALYAQVLRQWDSHDWKEHRGGTYTDASDFTSHLNTDGIDSLFPMWTVLHGSYENNKLTTAIALLAGHDHKNHNALSTLFNESTCKSPSGCAPYLQPLGLHANHTYPRKHAGLYITWIMYLAWQFWELLCGLLQALDNIDCTASGCATCPCQPGTHGGKDTCHCPSIVQCAGPLPTLYRYGFTYRNANLLVAANRTMRCGDLNARLKEALHSAHFTELFRQIDQLIWHIRMPFLYFLIALWTLVAMYILHTFLYRLDVLHIRSHLLTTNASHLIDVKALLIPSRKMLSLYDANYFDDDPAELLNLI